MRLKKQQGLATALSMLFAISMITFGLVIYSEKQKEAQLKATSQAFYERLLLLQTQLHAYVTDRYQQGVNIHSQALFPATLSELEGVYLPECTESDASNGLCTALDAAPWGTLSYLVTSFTQPSGTSAYRAQLGFELPDKNDDAQEQEYWIALATFMSLPNTTFDETANTLTFFVERPDMAFAYESLIKRSGDDSTLTGDWDVGGDYAIVNAKGVTLTNSDNSQTRVATGLTRIYRVTHQTWIDKISCPSGLSTQLELSISEMTVPSGYTSTGYVRPYTMSETATQYRIGIEHLVKNTSGTVITSTDGEVLAFMQCSS